MAKLCAKAGGLRRECQRQRLQLAPGRLQRAMRAVECALHQLQRQQAVPLIRTRAWPAPGLVSREAEAPIIGRIADQQDRGMAETRRPRRCAWRISAEPMPAFFSAGSTASGPSSSAAGPPSPSVTSHSRTVPTTRARRIARDKGQAFRRPAAAPQLLRRFSCAARAPWHGRAALRAPRLGRGFGEDDEGGASASDSRSGDSANRASSDCSPVTMKQCPFPRSFTSGALFHRRARAGDSRPPGMI